MLIRCPCCSNEYDSHDAPHCYKAVKQSEKEREKLKRLLLEACQVALERLEASQPPEGGRTSAVVAQVRSAIAKAIA